MSPEEIYLQNLPSIERIARSVAYRRLLNADDTDEFLQVVRVRIFENDYAIIRKYQGKSSITTYLTIVIQRLCSQWRIEQWGRWRPSAEAKRLGLTAILLERLLYCDGLSFHEAVLTLTTRSDSPFTKKALEAIYQRLPPRLPKSLPDEPLPDDAVAPDTADAHLDAVERARTNRRAREVLDAEVQGLPADDVLILQMHFWDALPVSKIAWVLHLDQKKLYRHLKKILEVLRERLEKEGISKSDIAELLTYGDEEDDEE